MDKIILVLKSHEKGIDVEGSGNKRDNWDNFVGKQLIGVKKLEEVNYPRTGKEYCFGILISGNMVSFLGMK